MMGSELIAKERKRQIEKEGWTAEHDDGHSDASLALAAICFAAPERIYIMRQYASGPAFYDPWPDSWDERWDKRYEYGENKRTGANYPPRPETYTKQERLDLLIKAGALIAAEIDRIKRIKRSRKNTSDL